jgi:hypothetical protein
MSSFDFELPEATIGDLPEYKEYYTNDVYESTDMAIYDDNDIISSLSVNKIKDELDKNEKKKVNEKVSNENKKIEEKLKLEEKKFNLKEHEMINKQKEKASLDATKEFQKELKHKQIKAEEDLEELEKVDIFRKIQKYYEYFPEKVKPNKRLNVNSKLNTRQSELLRCESVMQTDGALDNVKTIDILFNYIIEQGLIQTGLPAQGLAKEAKESQEVVMQELKEMSIKYDWFFGSGPEWRYLMKLITRIYIVLSRKSFIGGLPNFDVNKHEPIPHDLSNKYENL